jgi:Protein of unknown function (DUF3800)
VNALLKHAWGCSAAVDRVWAQVTGMAPSRAVRQVFMVLQAFVDDSYSPDGTFVLGGHIATAEAWAKFSEEWEKLLPLGTLAPNGKYHFKMTEMAANAERMARVAAFFRVIEKHVMMSLHVKLNLGDMERAKARVWAPRRTINWGFFQNPYLVAWRGLLDHIHGEVSRPIVEKVLPPGERIDFIFDEQTEKKVILPIWDEFAATRPDSYRVTLGSMPRFENDQEFLPLQAADFWAWWSRKWYADGTPEKLDSMNFGHWKVNRRDYPRLSIAYDEDGLVRLLLGLLRSEYPDLAIWDLAKVPDSRWPLGPIL